MLNEPDLCYTWGSHFHTFDGRYFFFPGRCTYKLVHDCQDDMFSVHVHSDISCKTNTNCRRAVNLYLGGMDIKVKDSPPFFFTSHFYIFIYSGVIDYNFQNALRQAIDFSCLMWHLQNRFLMRDTKSILVVVIK